MDAQDLIHSVLKGALQGRGKSSGRALRALTGSRSPLLNAGTLLTLGGLVWGVFEAATAKAGGATAGVAAAPPPLPNTGAAQPLPPSALQLVRLMVSAARADGALQPAEREAMLRHARAAGAEALVQQELDQPRPIAEIVAGVSELNRRQDLYVLAFAIVRADLGVSGAERIYLAQLAHRLGLSADEAGALEELAAAGIDAQSEGAS